jgi:hypothetical protein
MSIRGMMEQCQESRLPNSFAERPRSLRETAAKLMEHAETLIAKSAELEKRISRQNLENSALGKNDRRNR